VIVALILFKK